MLQTRRLSVRTLPHAGRRAFAHSHQLFKPGHIVSNMSRDPEPRGALVLVTRDKDFAPILRLAGMVGYKTGILSWNDQTAKDLLKVASFTRQLDTRVFKSEAKSSDKGLD